MRGLIDEYQYRQARSRMWATALGDLRVLLAVCGGIIVIMLQTVELVLIFTGGHE